MALTKRREEMHEEGSGPDGAEGSTDSVQNRASASLNGATSGVASHNQGPAEAQVSTTQSGGGDFGTLETDMEFARGWGSDSAAEPSCDECSSDEQVQREGQRSRVMGRMIHGGQKADRELDELEELTQSEVGELQDNVAGLSLVEGISVPVVKRDATSSTLGKQSTNAFLLQALEVESLEDEPMTDRALETDRKATPFVLDQTDPASLSKSPVSEAVNVSELAAGNLDAELKLLDEVRTCVTSTEASEDPLTGSASVTAPVELCASDPVEADRRPAEGPPKLTGLLHLDEAYYEVDMIDDMADVLLLDENGIAGPSGSQWHDAGNKLAKMPSLAVEVGPIRHVQVASVKVVHQSPLTADSFLLGEDAQVRELVTEDFDSAIDQPSKQSGKEFTVYCLRVSGCEKNWVVERRFRDLVALQQQLHKAVPEVPLPPVWSSLATQNWKVFSNQTPEVVEGRRELFEQCLQSLLDLGPPLCTALPFLAFLSKQGAAEAVSLPTVSGTSSEGASQGGVRDQGGPVPVPASLPPLGKTIRLVLAVQGRRPIDLQFRAQQGLCAGCYCPLKPAFRWLLSWKRSGPQLCEYSGQLFCTSCHTGETAVIPAHVLMFWDFRPRKVSQLAKAYLDSIYDQPMLCVSAVNPHLYNRVAALAHVRDLRARISRLFGTTLRRCPSRSRLLLSAGRRRYLLDPGDFFALRDLVDLSKGAFAVLPEFLRVLLEKFTAHATKECSLCREQGQLCGRGQDCLRPSHLIFPFQAESGVCCPVCRTQFHQECYLNEKDLPCPLCAAKVGSEEPSGVPAEEYELAAALQQSPLKGTVSDQAVSSSNSAVSCPTLPWLEGKTKKSGLGTNSASASYQQSVT